MDGIADDELAGALADLTRRLRDQLVRHAALGAWAAPGGATERSAAADMATSAAHVDAAAVDPDAVELAPAPREPPAACSCRPSGRLRQANLKVRGYVVGSRTGPRRGEESPAPFAPPLEAVP